jgi:hypothetical protein
MTTPNQPDITIGSRWRLAREEQPPDYVGIVSEINWRLREAHVHPEDRRGAGAWVSFDVLTQPAPLEVEVERQAGAAPADAAARDYLARLEEAADLAIRGFDRWKRNQRRGGNRHEAEHGLTDLGQAIYDLRELRGKE